MSRTEPIIVGPGQTRHAGGRSFVVPDELQCKVRTSDLGGRLCIMLADHNPWEGPPLHSHRDGDEWFYVVKGEFVYEVGGKLYRVVEGGSLVAPQKIPHRYFNGPTSQRTQYVPSALNRQHLLIEKSRSHCWKASLFLKWFSENPRPLAAVRLQDVDESLSSMESSGSDSLTEVRSHPFHYEKNDLVICGQILRTDTTDDAPQCSQPWRRRRYFNGTGGATGCPASGPLRVIAVHLAP